MRHRFSFLTVLFVAGFGLVAAPVSAQADAYDDITDRGRMIVAIDPTFAPFEFTDASGKIIGYDPELLEAIARDWGVEVEYQVTAFSGIIPGLIAGSFDFTPTALNVTAERAERISYTIPVASSVNAVLAREDSEKVGRADIEALSGLACAVKQTTQPEQMMQEMNEDLKDRGLEPVKLLSFDTVEQTIAALANERVDCVVDDLGVLTQALAQRPDVPMAIVGEIGPKSWIAWGTNKRDEKLTAALNEGLKKLKANGTMAALQQKYFGYVMDDLPEENFIPQE